MRFSNRLLTSVAVTVALVAWGGLGYLVYSVPPTLGSRLGLLGLLLVASAASGMPLILYLNHRFASLGRGRDQARAFRQSGWVGSFAALCAWLQMEQSLTWTAALVFLGVFALLELLFAGRGE